MNVRDEIRKAEMKIQTATVEAMKELESTTGLQPGSIRIDIVEASTYKEPYTRVIAQCKITVGI